MHAHTCGRHSELHAGYIIQDAEGDQCSVPSPPSLTRCLARGRSPATISPRSSRDRDSCTSPHGPTMWLNRAQRSLVLARFLHASGFRTTPRYMTVTVVASARRRTTPLLRPESLREQFHRWCNAPTTDRNATGDSGDNRRLRATDARGLAPGQLAGMRMVLARSCFARGRRGAAAGQDGAVGDRRG